MNPSDLLDYRPKITFQREVTAPLPSAEVYEAPEKDLTAPLAVFYRNRPSSFLQDAFYVSGVIEEKLYELSNEDPLIEKYSSMASSLQRQTLYANIYSISGDTNVIFFDRLLLLKEHLDKQIKMMTECFFGKGLTVKELQEKEQLLVDLLSGYEKRGDNDSVNYRTMSQDIKVFSLMKQYFYDMITASETMLLSNEDLETNIYTVDKALIPLYELQHDRAIRNLLDGKQSMDTLFNNDAVGNKLKRLYNLRTKLIKVTTGLTEEQVKEHSDQIRNAEEEISEQLLEATKELNKAIQSQKLSLESFNQGFKQKCEIIYSLKGGKRI